MFKIKARDLLGRLGELQTRSGPIETPTLAPVISVSGGPLSASEIKQIGFDVVITNAYLWMRKGEERNIHDALNVTGPVMTDSGAYQLLVYKSINTNNEEIIKYQEKIKTDIGVILDTPTGMVNKTEAELTVDKTLKSEEDAKKIITDEEIVWTAPIQGGLYKDLLDKMVNNAKKMDYPLYALGSPTPLMEGHMYADLFDELYQVKMSLPSNKPLHLFGAGHPSMFSMAVALGADVFDSAAYALFAKEGRYMTISGSEKIENLKELPCSCPVCSKYKPSELLKMEKREREKLLALHNLYASMAEIKTIRNAIQSGKLWDLVESRARNSPELWEAFKNFALYSDGFLKRTAARKISARGFSIIDEYSVYRPEVLWHINSMKKIIANRSNLVITSREYANSCEKDCFVVGFPFVITLKALNKVYPVYFAKFTSPSPEQELSYIQKKLVPILKDKKIEVLRDKSLAEVLNNNGIDAKFVDRSTKTLLRSENEGSNSCICINNALKFKIRFIPREKSFFRNILMIYLCA